MRTTYFFKHCRRIIPIFIISVLAASAAADPVQADTYDAMLSGNFTPGHTVTVEIPELEPGDSFTGIYEWSRTRISGDREPEILDSGRQDGRYNTYEITQEDVGWCISFFAVGTGEYADNYIYSYSCYVYPQIGVELSPDEYGHPGYVARVSTPGYDLETADNWLHFSYDWYTSDRKDGTYAWYSGEVATETEARTVLDDTEGIRYLKVRVSLDQGDRVQETEAVVELPWEDDKEEAEGGSAEGDGSGDSGGNTPEGGSESSGDGSSTAGGDGISGGSGSTGGNGPSTEPDVPADDNGSDSDKEDSSDSAQDETKKPDRPGSTASPATPSNADKPSGDKKPAHPEDSGNRKPEKPTNPDPLPVEGTGGGKPGQETIQNPSETGTGNQTATPSNAGGSSGGSALSRESGRSQSGNGEHKYLPTETASPEPGTEIVGLNLSGIPAGGKDEDSLPRMGDNRHPEIYRTVFVLSFLALILMVLGNENSRYHKIQETAQKEKKKVRYPGEQMGAKKGRKTRQNKGSRRFTV